MKREKTKVKNENKGITLIALVITIIVLLILAGVSIAMLTGENGVLTKATEAKDQTEIAQEKEEISMSYAAAKANKVDKVSEAVTADELNAELDKLNSQGEASGSGTLTVTYTNGHKYTINQSTGAITGPSTGDAGEGETTTPDGVTIPKGFYYVGGTKDEGIVISDNQEDENKGTSHEVAETLKGNQFVWVPVEDDEAFKRYEGYRYKDYKIELDSALSSCYEPSNGYATEEEEYYAMRESVLEHNGFYVARYEAGTENGERQQGDGIEDEVVSKQGVNVYNWIDWGQNDGAVKKSKEMYTDKKKYEVTSTLIYGVQWDAIMLWIDHAYKTGTCDINNSFVANSRGKGNYSGTLKETGSDNNYSVKNIYDLAGNIEEWTMETGDVGPYKGWNVLRGGEATNLVESQPASHRSVGQPSGRMDRELWF